MISKTLLLDCSNICNGEFKGDTEQNIFYSDTMVIPLESF